MGLMQLPETQNPAPEELEAFSRFEGSWQTIANQLAATAPAPPGPSLPPGKKQFLRVREVLVDSDGDGLLDVDELESVHPTNPLNPDSDGDGAYDGEPPAASDPAAADEDKDGIPDAEDAVPYDKDITWPRLNLQYAWAPAGNSWLPVSLNSKGQALCVKQDGTTWKAALMTDGAVSSTEVVFRNTATSANPNTDIRYMLRPIALSDDGSALFGDGTVYFPQRRYNFTSGATEIYPGNAALSAVLLPQATSLTRVLPPDQTTEPATMIGRQNSTLLGSQTPQNILAIQRCKASLMDGAGRLYAGLRDEANWPYLAGSNFNGSPGNYQLRTSAGSGLIWKYPNGPCPVAEDGSPPKTAFYYNQATPGNTTYSMRSYDAVSRSGKAIWRNAAATGPTYSPSVFQSDTGAVHILGQISDPDPTAGVSPVATPQADTPALPVPSIFGATGSRSYLGMADMPEVPTVVKDPLTGQALAHTDGPVIISRSLETWVRRNINGTSTWLRINLRHGPGLAVLADSDSHAYAYLPKIVDLRLPNSASANFGASALGQVLTNATMIWQNGATAALSALCQPEESLAGIALTSQLRDIWHAEINDEGLIAGEAWKKTTNPTANPTAWEGGLAVPYEFEVPDKLEIGSEIWASFSLPEHFLTARQARLTWWKKTPPDTTWTAATSALEALIDANGRLAFPIKAATGATSPFNASDDLPGAQPGEIWQARISIPRNPGTQSGNSAPWFICYSPPITIVPGQPQTIEIETSIPSGSNAWVADNKTETPVTIRVKDRKGNLVADGTEVSMDLYGTASTRPVFGSEAPVEEGTTLDFHRPVFLTANGRVTLSFRTFLTNSATAVIRSGTVEKELTIEYRGVQGTLSSGQSSLNTSGPGATTTASLSLTTPVADGTPVLWTVSRYAPGGIPLNTDRQGFDGAHRTVEGRITAQSATLPIDAAGAATGLCVITATVAEKLFVHTIAFAGGVSFSANLDREVLVADKSYSAATGRDYQSTTTPDGGSGRPINLSTAALGTINGVAGRTYQVRFMDPNGSSGLRLGLTGWGQQLPAAQTLEVTANASGIGQFYLSSSGQLSAEHVECVRLEVRDPSTTDVSLLQAGAIFETVGTCLFDAIGGFTGLGDTSGSYTGTVASIVGGLLSVNDVGALIKNGARSVGIVDGQVDKLETGLAALGAGATLATAAGGVGLAPKVIVQTLKVLKPLTPKLARILWKAFQEALTTGKEMANKWLMEKCALYVVSTDGRRLIKSFEDCFTNENSLEMLNKLTGELGEERVPALMLAVIEETKNLIPPDNFVANKVMWILDSLDETAKLALKEGSNLDEAKEIATGLAKLLSAVPTAGAAKAIDIAQLQRVLANKKLFRHPVPKMSSSYAQIDLLKDLAQVAKHTDADGVGRLIKALKSDSARVSGNRYALSVTADLIKNSAATEVKFISKFVGKWGTQGSAELDLVCKEAGQWVIYEIKSTYTAIGSQARLLGWQRRVTTGWPALGLGPVPKIKIMSPLDPVKGPTGIPGWLEILANLTTSGIKYDKGIPFK